MEESKAALHILFYSISQTSLEQVFIHFARQQVEPDFSVASRWEIVCHSSSFFAQLFSFSVDSLAAYLCLRRL